MAAVRTILLLGGRRTRHNRMSRSAADAPLTAEVPLHLENHIGDAQVEGASLSASAPEPLEWRSDALRTEWKRGYAFEADVEPASVEWAGDGLRLTFDEAHRDSDGLLVGSDLCRARRFRA